jgi:heme A synthase
VRASEDSGYRSDRSISRASLGAALSVFVLLLVGSYLSGTGGTGGFRDWPLMGGNVVPDLAVEAQAIHFFHRALAAIVGVIVFVVCFKVMRRKVQLPIAARFAHIGLGLFAIEVLIGAANIWTELNSGIVTAHLALGAATWSALVGMAAVTSPSLVEVPAAVRARSGRAPVAEGGR